MRGALIATVALALAACDSGGVPPPGQEPLRASAPKVAEDAVELRAEGLVAGPEAFYFAAGRREIETALSGVLGEPLERTESDECGAGPMEFTRFPGGLTVHFQKEFLVGWNLRTSGDDADIAVVGDVQIGTPRADAEAADGLAMIDGSTLGDEFALGAKMGGLFEDDAVSMLYAGAQCFFR